MTNIRATVLLEVQQGDVFEQLKLEGILNTKKGRSDTLRLPHEVKPNAKLLGGKIQLPHGTIEIPALNTYVKHPDFNDQRYAISRVSPGKVAVSYQGPVQEYQG